MRLLVCDPSTYYIGYAFLCPSAGGSPDEVFLAAFGLIKAPRKLDPLARTRVMGAGFIQLLGGLQPLILGYEDLEFHKSAAGISAARKGKLLMVAKLIGRLGCLWDQYALQMMKLKGELLACDAPIEVLPHMWKGNLPKSEVRRRVNVEFNFDFKSGTDEHVADAIGLAAWLAKSMKVKLNKKLGGENRRMDISPQKRKSTVEIVKA